MLAKQQVTHPNTMLSSFCTRFENQDLLFEPTRFSLLTSTSNYFKGNLYESTSRLQHQCARCTDSESGVCGHRVLLATQSCPRWAIPTGHGDEVIPPGSFPIYHVADAHRDPEVWTEPDKWNPARYLPDHADDKKKSRIYQDWGLGRHPYQGMRFAKLEVNIVTASFVAAIDFEGGLEDEQGVKLSEMENGDIDDIANNVPKKPYFLRFKKRAE